MNSEALAALDRREFAQALKLLEDDLAVQPEAELHALAGLANFQLERYEEAARHYTAALQIDGAHSAWRSMLTVAQANATAGVNVHVPALQYFDADELLAPASVSEGALPSPLPPARRAGGFKRLWLWLGWLIGAVGTLVLNGLTYLVGRISGYRDKIWTNWYRKKMVIGVLTLAYMRERLNKHNLSSSYPKGSLVGFQPAGQKPPPGVTHFRTADGTWNNLADPKEGAAGTRFLRNVEPSAIVTETQEQLLTPNPREISHRLLTRDRDSDGLPTMKEVPFLNLLAATWIQFMNGDWINHGEIVFDDVIEVPLPDDDPARNRYRQSAMFVGRTQPDPTRRDGEPAVTSSINEVTHWWDGSQIYGSDQATQDRLRSGVLGKMRIQRNGTLPVDESGVEDTGFRRNWWVGLSMMHALFVAEHNAICDMLHAAHPEWDGDDNRLFNVARLINAAVMAKIHSVEWTPAILPNKILDLGLNVNWYGLATYMFRKGKKRRTLSEINIRNAELGGIVGNPSDKHGQPFGLTEEFVEVYRLHSMLPETLRLRRRGDDDVVEELPFPETRQSGSTGVTARHPMSDLFYSFGNQLPGALQLNNFPRFLQDLSIPGNPFFDVGTVDVLRARERGVPRYNEFRRQLGLNPIESFDDLADDPHIRSELKAIYGDKPEDVEQLDLLIGTLAEGHRPSGFGFGETMFQIFILNASRRLQADRFYTDCYREEYYTAEGMRWIDQTDFKAVILRHHPELADTGLANVKNAFEPWDETPILDPTRHPLRASDSETKDNPWLGDGYRRASA
ncbi:peroxidase family protein [Mycolicibacterium stellerae]|uniref:peroxidase family protein n=1 Tax=Mycolicibacterium stellerae TaxID=2358193 RepID=UPI0013DE6774|nr:peroxidase family protein [Mycolicibacterium stellerae]